MDRKARALVAAACVLVLGACSSSARSAEPTTSTTRLMTPTTSIPAGPADLTGWTWRALPAPPEPVRSRGVVRWTGERLLTWGGVDAASKEANASADGARFDLKAGTWTSMAASPLRPRFDASSAWTGSELLVWGGSDPDGHGIDDGAAYDPRADRWRMLPPAPIRGAGGQVAAWTGSELLVWSSGADGRTPSVAAYSPTTDRWRALPGLAVIDAALRTVTKDEAFVGASASVWTGSELVLWIGQASMHDEGGGRSTGGGQTVVAALDPAKNSWRVIGDPPTTLPASAVWTGTTALLEDLHNFSGYGSGGGGIGQLHPPTTFDPADGSGHPISGGPTSDNGDLVSWTGASMVVLEGGNPYAAGVPTPAWSYDPAADRWQNLPLLPASLSQPGAVWAGDRLVVLGTPGLGAPSGAYELVGPGSSQT